MCDRTKSNSVPDVTMLSEPRAVQELACRHCGKVAPLESDVCPHCGGVFNSRRESSEPSTLRQSVADAIDNPWVVIGLLFGVMGPLAIPVLWRSRGFTWPMKIALSIAVCVYTTLLAWLAWLAVRMAWEQVAPLLGVLSGQLSSHASSP